MSSNVAYANQAPGATGVDPNHPARGIVEVIDGRNAIVRETAPDGSQRKKIAICGFAASSRNLAPFGDPTYSIWILNQLYRHVPRADREFDIHANWREDNVEGTDHPAWLAQCGIPVYMSSYEPTIPTCVNYPLQRVIERVAGTDYFTSTVAFMIGLAILEIDEQVEADARELERRAAGDEPDWSLSVAENRALGRVPLGDSINATYPGSEQQITAAVAKDLLLSPQKFRAWLAGRYSEREIAIFGIDLIVGTEYDFQKSCVEFLLGIAQARNITIRIPEQCALLKQRWRYGYEAEPAAWPIKMSELRRRGEALTNERNTLIARLQTIDGALQEWGYWHQIHDLRSKNGTVKLNEDPST